MLMLFRPLERGIAGGERRGDRGDRPDRPPRRFEGGEGGDGGPRNWRGGDRDEYRGGAPREGGEGRGFGRGADKGGAPEGYTPQFS